MSTNAKEAGDNLHDEDRLSEEKLDLDVVPGPLPPLPPIPPEDFAKTLKNPFIERPRFNYSIPEPEREQLKAQAARADEAQALAKQLLRAGELVEAEAQCRRAIALRPHRNGKPLSSEPLPLLGEILLAQGRNQEALEVFLEGKNAVSPDRWSLSVALAYCRLGDLEVARNFYLAHDRLRYTSRVQVEDLPGTADLHSLEASVLLARAIQANVHNDPEEALANYEAAALLSPANWFIAEGIALTLDSLGRRDEAVPYYKRAVQHGGDKVSEDTKRLARGGGASEEQSSHPSGEIRLS